MAHKHKQETYTHTDRVKEEEKMQYMMYNKTQ